MIPLFPKLVHNGISLLYNNLHFVVLIRHPLHLLYWLLKTFLQLLILGLQVQVFILCPLQDTKQSIKTHESQLLTKSNTDVFDRIKVFFHQRPTWLSVSDTTATVNATTINKFAKNSVYSLRMVYKLISKDLKVFQALVELAIGQVELFLSLCILIFGRDWLFLVQLSTIEIHILLELLSLLWCRVQN